MLYHINFHLGEKKSFHEIGGKNVMKSKMDKNQLYCWVFPLARQTDSRLWAFFFHLSQKRKEFSHVVWFRLRNELDEWPWPNEKNVRLGSDCIYRRYKKGELEVWSKGMKSRGISFFSQRKYPMKKAKGRKRLITISHGWVGWNYWKTPQFCGLAFTTRHQ